MASLLLRSAAGRVLARSIPLGLGSFRWSPRRFLSGGAQRIESKARFEIALEKYSENLQKAHEATLSLLEQEKRFEQQEQQQMLLLSYLLLPAGAGFFIFGPDKKETPEEAIETST
ncbi:hypothetical protein ACQJBY_057742 [Aegilops geniculata]